MEFYNTTHVEIIVFSSLLGLIFAFLYDIIRITEILCGVLSYSAGKTRVCVGKTPKVFLFIGDAVYMLSVTVMFSLFVYCINYGDYRWFMAAGAAVGFAAYEFSLGRLVMAVAGTVVNGVRIALRYAVVIPTRFVGRMLYMAFAFVYRLTIGRIGRAAKAVLGRAKTERMRRKLREDIRFSRL